MPQAVLFDRDGTLVEDVLYNRDPARVRSTRGGRWALEQLRAAVVEVGVVTNQSGIGPSLVLGAALARDPAVRVAPPVAPGRFADLAPPA